MDCIKLMMYLIWIRQINSQISKPLLICYIRGQPSSKTFTCPIFLKSFEVLPPGGFFSQPNSLWNNNHCDMKVNCSCLHNFHYKIDNFTIHGSCFWLILDDDVARWYCNLFLFIFIANRVGLAAPLLQPLVVQCRSK